LLTSYTKTKRKIKESIIVFYLLANDISIERTRYTLIQVRLFIGLQQYIYAFTDSFLLRGSSLGLYIVIIITARTTATNVNHFLRIFFFVVIL